MSILIKGKKMPKNCAECPCRMIGYTKDHCNVLGKFIDFAVGSEGRREDCPLIEVPPHGRLIDADVLVEDLERQCKEVFRIDAVSPDDYWITRNEAYNEALWKTWVESFDNYLKTRPTVIHADKDGET